MGLSLISPTIKKKNIGKETNIEYILLPKFYKDFNYLQHDIKNGADIYRPCIKPKRRDESSIATVVCRSREDGYRAVSYLEANNARNLGHEEEIEEFAFTDEWFKTMTVFDTDTIYKEHFSRIPIIEAQEIERLESCAPDELSFGYYEVPSDISDMKNPWWNFCWFESICIVQECKKGSGERMSNIFIKAFDRFAHSRQVYMLLVTDETVDEDRSVGEFIHKYNSEYYDLVSEASEEQYEEYRNLLFGEKLEEDLSEINDAYGMDSLEEDELFEEEFGEESEKSLDDYLKELNNLIGLESVKKCVEELVDSVFYKNEAAKRGIEVDNSNGSLHMAFMGNPGTGKTVVARLIGKIFAKLGILKSGNVFVEVSRADLVGGYMGQTAIKVSDAVKSAMGGVLFIDEAYSLVQDDCDSYGKEAVDTLIAEMENNRESLVVIIAGYEEKIRSFMRVNPGMTSRISTELVFDDYSIDEMMDIFAKMIDQSVYKIEESGLGAVREIISIQSLNPDFGNARGVRNIFEKAVKQSESRLAKLIRSNVEIDDTEFNLIKENDIRNIGL